jgi:hypothetical protein
LGEKYFETAKVDLFLILKIQVNDFFLKFQSKFPERMKEEPGWNPAHGIRLECTCVVVLNALGYIGFKVIATSGDRNEYLWTLERNLDMDTHYQAKIERDYNN